MIDTLAQVPNLIIGYIVPALLVLTIVVFFHELGHYFVARLCNVKIDVFSIGFGRELFGRNDRNGTRWKVSAVPLGGYVKFAGDENAASLPDEDVLETLSEADRSVMFHFKPVWQRALVVAAGPVANFILAVAIFAVLFGSIGRPGSAPIIESVVEDSAAEKAGLLPGDRIISMDGRSIRSFSDIQRIVMLASDQPLALVINRDGETLELEATPERKEVPDGLGSTHRVGILGISRSIEPGDVVYETYGPVAAIGEGVRETWVIIERTMTYVSRLVTGRENADQLSGPVRVAQVSGVVASSGGIVALLHLAAILSVSIGFLNLFPIPMLDGGHLVFYLIESVRGRPLSQKAQEMSFRIGFALVIVLFMFVTFNDIVKIAGV